MNVLDVYPTFSWWICGSSAGEVAANRHLLELDSDRAEIERKAFYLVGDAAAFDLLADTFDEIVVRYEPGPLRRLVLQRHTRPWLRPGAQLQFEPEETVLAASPPASDSPHLSIYPLAS